MGKDTQGRIANQVCRPRQDLRLAPPAVFGTHLVLYLNPDHLSRFKSNFPLSHPSQAREKGPGKNLRFFPVLPPQAEEELKSFSAGRPPEGLLLPLRGNSPSVPAENSLTRAPWSRTPVTDVTGGGVARRGACSPPKDVRSSSPCSSSRRGPWWTQPRSCGYTGPWRRRASPSRWHPSGR